MARNTIKEILRDRILYSLVLFAFGLIGLSLLLGQLSFAEQGRIITNLGLAAGELGSGMLAIFVGSSLVWREIEKQTILTLISKPISRRSFILGKWLGLASVLSMVVGLLALVLSLVCIGFGDVHWKPFLIANFTVFLESLILLCVALFFGVFARPMLTTLFTVSIWIVGHGATDLAFFSSKSENPTFRMVGGFLSRVVPNFEYLNFKTAALYNDLIPIEALTRAVGVWALWTLLLLLATTWIFEKRDFI